MFEEDEKDQEKREEFLEKKRKLTELELQRREIHKAIKDTFKNIIIDGNERKQDIQTDLGQGKFPYLNVRRNRPSWSHRQARAQRG